MNKIILVDVDDVLLNCSTVVHQQAQLFFQTSLPDPETWPSFEFAESLGLTRSQWRDFEAFLKQEDNLATFFDWYQGAEAFVERLASFGEVVFCTAHWDNLPHWYETRRKKLEHFLGRRGYSLVTTNQKHLVRGDILIDDKWANIEKTPERGILWAKSYNLADRDKAEYVAHNYTQALSMIANWKKIS